ncbi:MAG: metallopeptidase family protein [Rhodobacteraceae bacterium]|nr:metallopeptidase family protein [Paracoccaceae bacterium]
MDWTDATAPDLDDLEAMARAAIDALPPDYRAPARAVQLRIAEFAPDDVLDEMQIDDAYEVTGLYQGIPMTQKSFDDGPVEPDVIWLFRRPILEEWCGRGDIALTDLVSHVFVHELAHHFGWSDADIAAIDRWWE